MQNPRTRRPAHPARIGATLLLGLAGVGLMLIPAGFAAGGDTTTHARLHLAGSAVMMTVSAIVALCWPNTRRRLESLARQALVLSLAVLAGSQLAESAGAFAWETDGETVRSQPLHVLHTCATITSGILLVAVGVSAVAAAATLLARLSARLVLRAGTTTLLALALVGAAGSARASSIVYVKGNSIWRITPDGAHPTRLTRDGRKFASPSQADNGTIVALGADNHLYRFTHTGKPLGRPVATWLGLGGGQGFSGPYRPRVSPDGSKVAYTVLHVQGLDPVSGNSEIEGITSYSYANRYTPPGALGLVKGWDNPAWIDNGHTMAFNPGADSFPDGVEVAYHALGHADPRAADDMHHAYTWFDDPAASYMVFGDISRHGDKLAVGEDGFAATRTIRLYSVGARPPYRDDAPIYRCRLVDPPGTST